MSQSESEFWKPAWVILRVLSAILTNLINHFLYFVFFFVEQHFDFWLFPNILLIYFLQIQNSFFIFEISLEFYEKSELLKVFLTFIVKLLIMSNTISFEAMSIARIQGRRISQFTEKKSIFFYNFYFKGFS